MIFTPDLAAKITLGKKTVTRRPVKVEGGVVVPCRYLPGRTYAVQLCRGGTAVDRVRIVSVTRETLHVLTQEEAEREGFSSPRAFTAKWDTLYGPKPPGDVWRIEFELAPAGGSAGSNE